MNGARDWGSVLTLSLDEKSQMAAFWGRQSVFDEAHRQAVSASRWRTAYRVK